MTFHDSGDAEVWDAAVTGDERAFGVLFDRHGRTVYNYCFRRTADWSAAEDLTSVVFLETWRRRSTVRMEGGSLLPWLYGVATNVLRIHPPARPGTAPPVLWRSRGGGARRCRGDGPRGRAERRHARHRHRYARYRYRHPATGP